MKSFIIVLLCTLFFGSVVLGAGTLAKPDFVRERVLSNNEIKAAEVASIKATIENDSADPVLTEVQPEQEQVQVVEEVPNKDEPILNDVVVPTKNKFQGFLNDFVKNNKKVQEPKEAVIELQTQEPDAVVEEPAEVVILENQEGEIQLETVQLTIAEPVMAAGFVEDLNMEIQIREPLQHRTSIPADTSKFLVLLDTTIIEKSVENKDQMALALSSLLQKQVGEQVAKENVEFSLVWFNSFTVSSSEWISIRGVDNPESEMDVRSQIDDIVFNQITYHNTSLETVQTSNWHLGFQEAMERLNQYNGQDETNFRLLFIASSNPHPDTFVPCVRIVHEMKERFHNFRLVGVSLSSDISISLVQTLSGRHPQLDFYVSEWNRQDMLESYVKSSNIFAMTMRHALSQSVCSEGVQDQCGVCFGDDSTCTGCDGKVNSLAAYDVCGVCNGKSNTCGVQPPVTNSKRFQISQNAFLSLDAPEKGGKLLTVEVKWFSLPLEMSEEEYDVIITLEPFVHPSQLEQQHPPSKCEFLVPFGKQTPEESMWKVALPEIQGDATSYTIVMDYTALTEECKEFFTISDSANLIFPSLKDVTGTVFVNAVSRVKSDRTFEIYSTTKFDFTVSVLERQQFVLFPKITDSDVSQFAMTEFQRVDLLSGDIAFYFNTTIQGGHYLADGHIIKSQEMADVPMHLFPLDEFGAPVLNKDYSPCNLIDGSCQQSWMIRSFGALGVKYFSNMEPLSFSVYKTHSILKTYTAEENSEEIIQELQINYEDKGIPSQKLLVVAYLELTRHSDPKLDNQLRPWLKMDHLPTIDSQKLIQTPENGTLVEIPQEQEEIEIFTANPTVVVTNNRLLVTIGSNPILNHGSLKMKLDMVLYCASKYGNLLPYDVSKPESTGCNTLVKDVKQILIYRNHFNTTSGEFEESLSQDFKWEENANDHIAFSIQALRLSQYQHIIQAHYHMESQNDTAEQNAYLFDPAMSAEERKVLKTTISNHQRLVDQKLYFQEYPFAYTKRIYFEPLKFDIVNSNKQWYRNAKPAHASFKKTLSYKDGHNEFLQARFNEMVDHAGLELNEPALVEGFFSENSFWFTAVETNSSEILESDYDALFSYLMGKTSKFWTLGSDDDDDGSSSSSSFDDDDEYVIVDDDDEHGHHHGHYHHHGDLARSKCFPIEVVDIGKVRYICHYHDCNFFDNDPAHTVVQTGFVVDCGSWGYWKSGECVKGFYQEFCDNDLWGLFVFFIFIILLLACIALCYYGTRDNDDITTPVPYTLNPNMRGMQPQNFYNSGLNIPVNNPNIIIPVESLAPVRKRNTKTVSSTN